MSIFSRPGRAGVGGPAVGLLVALLKAVGHLALDANGQMRYLNELGIPQCADELALELNDVVNLVPQFVVNEWLTEADALALGELDQLLTRMSGRENESLWTPTALENAPEWREVRRLARTVLSS